MQIIKLQRGRTRATITPELGGRIAQLSVHDGARWLPLLVKPHDPAGARAKPLSSGSFVMAPWPNRIDGRRFLFEGRLYEVPVRAGDHALHGTTVYRPWALESQTPHTCRLSIDLGPEWPFGGRASQHISLHDDGITQRIEIHSVGDTFPAGAGWHPWFRRDVRPGADVRVLIDAAQVYETQDMIPTGWLKPALGETDLRTYTAIGGRRLDTCYRHPRGPMRIAWGDIELTMRSSRNVGHAVVYTLPRAVCVEPQTCAIDAFNLDAQGIAGAGTIIVAPGRPLVAWTDWRWTIYAPDQVVAAKHRQR